MDLEIYEPDEEGDDDETIEDIIRFIEEMV